MRTSDATDAYNCFAWAAGDRTRWWDPTAYWPGSERVQSLLGIQSAYATLGYQPCHDGSLEQGLEKLAFYAILTSERAPARFTHAALQLPSGRWSSKIGQDVDVEHSLDELAGPAYGHALYFMARPRTG